MTCGGVLHCGESSWPFGVHDRYATIEPEYAAGAETMPKVTIQPLGITVEAEDGQTIMDAARAAGYYWPTTCDGKGECTTCAGMIERGMDNLSPMGRYETNNLVRQRGRLSLQSPIRLCCQARVHGDVEVRKPGVKPW